MFPAFQVREDVVDIVELRPMDFRLDLALACRHWIWGNPVTGGSTRRSTFEPK
jgi:hypothetical protein